MPKRRLSYKEQVYREVSHHVDRMIDLDINLSVLSEALNKASDDLVYMDLLRKRKILSLDSKRRQILGRLLRVEYMASKSKSTRETILGMLDDLQGDLD
jgi:hypothetical protein